MYGRINCECDAKGLSEKIEESAVSIYYMMISPKWSHLLERAHRLKIYRYCQENWHVDCWSKLGGS